MASPDQVIFNPVTKDRIKFVETSAQTGGRLLRFEEVMAADGIGPPAHLHPRQEERISVIKGTMKLTISRTERLLQAGDEVTLAPGTPHQWDNDGDDDLQLLTDFRPALRTEEFFETLYALAGEGKVDDRGIPAFLQLAVLVPAGDIWLANPPLVVQKLLFAALTPLARARGYRASYPSRVAGGSSSA